MHAEAKGRSKLMHEQACTAGHLQLGIYAVRNLSRHERCRQEVVIQPEAGWRLGRGRREAEKKPEAGKRQARGR
jgi:hypothetical protein